MTKSRDALPPHSEEAERATLACVLSGANLFELTQGGLNASWFYDLRHRRIFEAALGLARQGATIELPLLCAALKSDREFPDAFPFLMTLYTESVSAVNWPYWLDILKNKAQRRAVITVAARLNELATDETRDPTAVFLDAQDVLESFSRAADSKALPEILDASTLVSEPMTEPRELVPGVLHQGAKLVFGGGSKSFKTWGLLDLALSVSHGEPWLGFKTGKGRALYLNMELPAWAFRQRIADVARAKGMAIKPGQLDVWNLRGFCAAFDMLFPKIKREIRKSGHALIILDPIYKLYGQTDENAAGDVARLMNALEDLSTSTGAAVAFGAHFSKGNQASKEAIDRISGSGVFARDPDSILVLTKHEEEDAFTVEATLRNFKPVDPFVVRWQFPLLRRDESLDPARLKQAGGRKPEHLAGELLEVLPNSGTDNKAWLDSARTEQGITERTFYRLRGELVAAGKVLKSKVNGKWMPVSKCP